MSQYQNSKIPVVVAVVVCTILQIRPKTEIRLHFGRSRIWAGFLKMAGFRPEPKSGTALVSAAWKLTTLPLLHAYESVGMTERRKMFVTCAFRT
jgi:hypothetical protein